MSTAENIKKLRRKLCLTMYEFAKELNIGPGNISKYENGERQPSYPTIRKIIALAKKHGIEITLDDIRED